MKQTRGFTLIELLVVIGILSILATTVTLVLNPANILKESRDVQRLSDLRNLNGAIAYYLARPASGVILLNANIGQTTFCDAIGDISVNNDGSKWYASHTDSPGSGTTSNTKQPFQFPMDAAFTPPTNGAVVPEATIRRIDGTGWVPIPFSQTMGGSSLPKLPIDPSPDTVTVGGLVNGGRYYAYRCEGFRYEINANMESDKYSGSPVFGAKDAESTDGGTLACRNASPVLATRCQAAFANSIYEVGNDPGLDL